MDFFWNKKIESEQNFEGNTLNTVDFNREYLIKNIRCDDKSLKNFLFSLGCYEGGNITIVSKLCDTYIVAIKDGRYSIDEKLASIIEVE